MIEVEQLGVRYAHRGLSALTGVTLRVAAGEHVALVGPSGAGKTTLLRALLGAVPAATGTVRVDGLDPWGSPAETRALRRRVAMLRQGGDLVSELSARSNIAMGAIHSWGWRDWCDVALGSPPRRWATRIAALARRHGIEECLTARVTELSGGQRQRVALCRALLSEPLVLLADEPTAQLDPAAAAEALAALNRVHGTTVIVATHDLALARAFPRQIALRNGRMVHDGPRFDRAAAGPVYGIEA